MVDKVIRDGMVAVLISPGFGAGWFTWNPHHPQMLFDPVIVEILLNAKKGKEAFVAGQIVAHVEANYSDYYAGGVDNLEVEWVPVGTEFIVDEYDGDETIRTKDGFAWIKA
jgi:hypothetical protein